MLNQNTLTQEIAAYKKDSRKYFDDAVAALIALAWPYREEGFSFRQSSAIFDKATGICIELSDRCAANAKKHLSRVIESLEWDGYSVDDAYGDDEEKSLDMAGSHLLELLAIWIGVAAINEWTQGYTRIMLMRYLANPFLCPEWKDIPPEALAWGRGYAKDIAEQYVLIGQGIILSGARYAEQQEAIMKGAAYYVRHRGSNYDCDTCDELSEVPIPIGTPFEIPHPRCMCYPEYFYEPLPE